jgi:TonB-dependent starch-binding outer membrane protein SusC
MKKNLSIKLLMPKKIIALILIIFGITELNAQSVTITGRVTDDNGSGLPGVNVLIKNTTSGTITDVSGNYSIFVPSPESVLTFSFIGYASEEVPVLNKTEINIVLIPNLESLEEVIVVGYGAMKKRNVTGSIASVKNEDIENTPVKDVLNALQGRAAGVSVVSNSGAPGAGVTLRVRGNTSLNSGNGPLYVVDGVAIESKSVSALNVFETNTNPLADINPADIESIEILKDAASTAIYGSRAANGVVLITTKRGKTGKPQFKLNVSTGQSRLSRKLSVLNAYQYRELVKDAYYNVGNNNITWGVADSLNPMNSGDVDWQDIMYRVAPQTQVDLSVLGGSEALKYAFSTAYLNQDGILLGSNYKRISARLNTDYKLSPKLTVGNSISYSNGVTDRVTAAGSGNLSLTQSILVRPPTYSMTYPDGSPINYFNGKRNPVALAEDCTHLNQSNRIIGNQYLEYQIIEGLKFRTNISIDFIAMQEDEFYPTTVDYRKGYNSGSVRATNNLTWINENYFSYDKSINGKHNLTFLAGMSEQKWKYQTTGLKGRYFTSDKIRTLNGAAEISENYVNTISEHSMLSYFGRAGYNYQSKYLIEFNLRADGSSRFGANNRFGYFPSTSAAWRFSAEPFMSRLRFLNDGKIRISVGQTGNEAIGDFTAKGTFNVGINYLDYPGAAPTVMPNLSLSWETTTQYNGGIDLAFLDSRIIFNADLYLKKTENLLYAVPVPSSTGFNYITQNIGEIENRGAEFSFFTHNISSNFNWTTNFNISFNRNKVIDLPDELLTNGYIGNNDLGINILKEGEPIGVFYGWIFDGVYSRDEDNVNQIRYNSETGHIWEGGEPIFRDKDGNNIIDTYDRGIIGNPEPKFFGGITNDFSYKNFTLSVFLQYSYGNDIYSYINYQRNMVFRYNNCSTDALDRWREQGDVTNFPKPIRDDIYQADSRIQSRWVEDGSYLKLKNVSLSYNVPDNLVSKARISSMKAYISAQNLITWTHYTAYDPDVDAKGGLQPGIDWGAYPQSRTFILGINLEF